MDAQRAVAKPEFAGFLKEMAITKENLAAEAGISVTTLRAVLNGQRVSASTTYALESILGGQIREYFDFTRNDTALGSSTVYGHHRLIRMVLGFALKERRVEFNAAALATPPQLPKHETKTLQPEDVAALLAALESAPIKWRVYVHLLLMTGARRGAIAGLEWSKIDWANSRITLNKALLYSKTRGVYEDEMKTKKPVIIKLPDETMELLREYRSWFDQLREANGDRWRGTDYMFVHDDGAVMHPDSGTKKLGQLARKHGLEHVHPHKLRHTLASLLHHNGLEVAAISKRLGHSNINTTLKIYTHMIDVADEQAAEIIANVILRPNSPKSSP
jgi:integrase